MNQVKTVALLGLLSGLHKLFSTHSSTEARIQNLLKLEQELQSSNCYHLS